jgi:3-phosphoshikimate 1-carboxyvinyltransferase
MTTPPPAQYAVHRLPKPVDAVIAVPGSKSITNRALILAALAEGKTILHNTLFSEDSHWCMEALRALGVSLLAEAGAARAEVVGSGGRWPAAEADIFVGNSGTTARFMTAAAALGKGIYHFDGVPRMRQRPIQPLVSALEGLGAHITSHEGCFPLTIQGRGLRGKQATLDATASSQYITALLQVATYAEEDFTLSLIGELVSVPYVEMTLRLMEIFGIGRESVMPSADYRTYHIKVGARYQGREYTIEPDASNATYFFAAAAVTGGRVRVPHLPSDSLQGDMGFLDVLAQMGCMVEKHPDYVEVRGPQKLRGLRVDMNAISDTAQTLAAIAPFADGPVQVYNIAHVRHKETDRIAAVVAELQKRGVFVEESADGFTVHPSAIQPGAVDTYDDHRMAMAFAVMGLAAEGITINNPGCTAKTFPDFFTRFEKLYEATPV